MNLKRLALAICVAVGLTLFCPPVDLFAQEEVSIGQLFIDAYTHDNMKEMKAIIEKHKEGVPKEVQSMVMYAMSKDVESNDEQNFLIEMARKMSVIFKEKTGDGRLLTAVEANIKKLIASRGPSHQKELDSIKEEITKLGKGGWTVRIIKFEQDVFKMEIQLREKESSFSNRYVSFKDAKEAKEIVKKYIPDAKGRIDWTSGGMGMKAVILE